MKKLFKLAGIWVVMFSMAVQTTGAASLATLGAPMAARNMMPPPSLQALQAVLLKSLPPAAQPMPAPKKIDPKVRVPAEWSFYVLAAGEVALESGTSALASLKNESRAMTERGATVWSRGAGLVSRAISSLRDLAADFMSQREAAPEPLARVDLAAPVPAEQPTDAPWPDASADLPAQPQQSMQVVREPMAISRAGMLINSVNPVAVVEDRLEVPEAPQDRMLVAGQRLPEPTGPLMRQLQGEDAERAMAPINDARNVRKFPRLNPPNGFAGTKIPGLDRRKLNAQLEAEAVMPQVNGNWNEGKGLRFRLVFLNPVGFSQADGRGFQYNMPGKMLQNPAEVLPQQYWGTYAIYQHGQTVNYEIEIENTGKEPIKDLTVVAAQEVFSREGGAGRRLPAQAGEQNIPVFEPGRTVKLRNQFRITSDWAWHGSLEQTHVRMTARSFGGTGINTLAEAYQAGLIDPPPDM